MSLFLTRRRALAAGAASLAALPAWHGAFAATPRALTAETRTIEVNGRAAPVFGLRQPSGESGLVLEPGARFLVDLANRSSEDTIVHWHGQTPPPSQDGVTDTGYAGPIVAGASRLYDFAARPGTHWMHSHHGLQEQALMAAPLVVHSEEDRRRDAQEAIVLLHDFSFRSPAEILASVAASMAHGGVNMPAGGHAGHSMAGMAMAPGGLDLNDFNHDAYLANDRTLADPQLVRAEPGGRVLLRLINGATSTAFWIELGALEATVLAADGNDVRPVTGRRFPLAQGQRLDLLVTLPKSGGAFPVLAQREGDVQQTGIILATPGARIAKQAAQAAKAAGAIDLSLEGRLIATAPPPVRPAAVTHRVVLDGSMMPYRWSIDGRSWSDRQKLRATPGDRVEIEMVNRSPMAHPMHLHGHHFQVIGINGQALAGAVRDTVLVPVNGSVRIAFDADNPGRWLFHCHNLFHMATGMMTEFAYGETS